MNYVGRTSARPTILIDITYNFFVLKTVNENKQAEEQKPEIICDCTGTTKEKVLSLIKQKADLDKISSATGATTGCGACDAEIINLIDKHGD